MWYIFLINNNTFYFGLLKINRAFGKLLLLWEPVSHLPWQYNSYLSGKQESQCLLRVDFFFSSPSAVGIQRSQAAGNINDMPYTQ